VTGSIFDADKRATLVPEPPKRQRRSKAQQRAESLEQILDAAEYLFSKYGLYGVALRDVAQRVGIHTTLLHYYFEDKRNLFEAVFARRAGVTSERRIAALEQYERESGDKLSKALCTPFSTPISTSTSRGVKGG
jgi:AcrR family transcriptional regulator